MCIVLVAASCGQSYDRSLGDVVNSLDEGNSPEALSAANRAVSARPDCYLGYWHRGQAREALHDYQGAIDDYDIAEKLCATNPTCGDDCSNSVMHSDIPDAKVGALIKLMRYSEARALLAELDVKYDRHPFTDSYEAMMHLASGELETADTLFKSIADQCTDGYKWRALRASAFTSFLRGDHAEATRRISLACADHRDPSYRRIESVRGREEASLLAMHACINAMDRRGVIESFQKAEELAVFPPALIAEWSK